ncbi:uncharacterized protein C20orf96-like [Sorex fumeus]|uniref:uncharacterized protein C20orf96-like n=1 Tax=Sorex fumeus TaxID=62283 RepID=UPI0024AD80B3|nr:uncharacterized protein C20orf96-like [Sorex fumeus]
MVGDRKNAYDGGQRLYFKPTKWITRTQQEINREKLEVIKMQSKFRLIRSLLRNRRATLFEFRNHEHLLATLSQDLVNKIRDLDDSSARKVQALLQQQKTLSTIIDVLEYVHKKKLQDLKSEVQEWEEKEDLKVHSLEKQMAQLKAQIQRMHEQVNFLSTYMDHEYPVKSIQIAMLGRQLQQLKDSHQEELEDLREMQNKVLQSLYDRLQRKRENILHSLVMKTLSPHQEVLLQKTREIQDLLRYKEKFGDYIAQLEEKMPVLRAEVKQLQEHILEPREVLFADILLRRPKCTPDMDVILDIPVEEVLPF